MEIYIEFSDSEFWIGIVFYFARRLSILDRDRHHRKIEDSDSSINLFSFASDAMRPHCTNEKFWFSQTGAKPEQPFRPLTARIDSRETIMFQIAWQNTRECIFLDSWWYCCSSSEIMVKIILPICARIENRDRGTNRDRLPFHRLPKRSRSASIRPLFPNNISPSISGSISNTGLNPTP